MTKKTKKLVQKPKKLQFASTAPWMQEEKPIISPETIAKYRKEASDRHAQRAVQERNQERLNRQNRVQVDNSKARAEGTIQNTNKVQVDKALSWYGISNGLGQMSNVSDTGRNTKSFGNFAGKESLRPIETAAFIGPILVTPQTAAFGFVNSLLGSYVGGKVGKKLGNEQAGEVIGSFAMPSVASGFNAATRPLLQRAFSNNFSDAFGYHQVLRIPSMLRDYGRGLVGKGPKKHPVITSNENELSVAAEREGMPVIDRLNYEEGTFEYTPDRHIIGSKLFGSDIEKPNTFNVQRSINRAQAVSKYEGATDSETPLYLKNKNGSYQYNQEENSLKPHQMLNSSLQDKEGTAVDEMIRAMEADRPIVTIDSFGGNGGNVQLTYDGSFMHNGEPYHRFMMRDLWDLQPIGGLGNALAHLMEGNVNQAGIKGTLAKIGTAAPALPKLIRKVSSSPIVNREVGRVVGGKPFMLEHPFAVSERALQSRKGMDWRTGSLNIFSNKKVPGATYSSPETWDLPFNLGITERNLTYPIFNQWKLQQSYGDWLQQFQQPPQQ